MASNPEGESLLDEFVELFNARDFEGLAELIGGEVSSELFEGTDRPSVIASMQELVLRQPSITATRGEVEDEPLLALWLADGGRYCPMGYLMTSFEEDGEEPLIERLDYVEELDDEDVLVEEPEEAEIPEWDQSEDEWALRTDEKPTWVG